MARIMGECICKGKYSVCQRKVICGYKRWVDECLVEKIFRFWWKYFSSISFVGLHLFWSNLWPDKWDLYERYGGPNLGEKSFQLFQLLQYRLHILTRQIMTRIMGECMKRKVECVTKKVICRYKRWVDECLV